MSCEHSDSLKQEFKWLYLDPSIYGGVNIKHITSPEFPLCFQPNRKISFLIKRRSDFKEVAVTIDSHPKDLECFLWTEQGRKILAGSSTQPVGFGQFVMAGDYMSPPTTICCKIVFTKCHQCNVERKYQKQMDDMAEKYEKGKREVERLRTEMVEVRAQMISMTQRNETLTEELGSLKAKFDKLEEQPNAATDGNPSQIGDYQMLWGMVAERKFTDFCFKVDNKTIEVHKAILAAKSGFFKEQLEIDSSKREFTINGVKAEVVEALVQFVYSGRVDNFKEFVDDLYELAVKFSIPSLKKKCIEFTEAELMVEDAIDLFVSAVDHDEHSLSRLVINDAGGDDKAEISLSDLDSIYDVFGYDARQFAC